MAKLELLTVASLHAIDGLAADFDSQLAAAVLDCRERPGNNGARKIKICVEVSPCETGDDVTVHVTTESRSPSRRLADYRMMATRNGGLKFNPQSPSDPNQETLDFDP